MRRLIFCAGVVLLAVVGVMHKMKQPELDPYAFRLPTMFFDTLSFPMPEDGATIYGWKFEQCVRMDFSALKGTIHMPGSYEFGGLACGPIHLPGAPTVGSITFGPGDKVRIDQMEINK